MNKRSPFLTSPIASLDNSSDCTTRSTIALFPHKKDRLAIAPSRHAKRVKRSYPEGNRIQQLQQQIEAWQALLEKLGGMEGE
jgi:hypothetical protein